MLDLLNWPAGVLASAGGRRLAGGHFFQSHANVQHDG